MKLTYFIYLQLTICWLTKHFTVIYGDANKQVLTLNLNIFCHEKISLSGTPISLPKIADLPIWTQEKITCMNDWQQIKQVAQRATIAHLSPMCQGQISFKKIQTHPSFNACSCYMKVSKGSNQKQQRKSGNTIFPIIRSIGVFLRRSRAANSIVGGPIWPKLTHS